MKSAYHYVECPKCESCFKVAKSVTAIPTHKCWAEEKARTKRVVLDCGPGCQCDCCEESRAQIRGLADDDPRGRP